MKTGVYEQTEFATPPSPDFALKRKITLSRKGRGVVVGKTLLWEEG